MSSGISESLNSRAIHLCIDMQRIFSEGGLWPTPWMTRVLPRVVELTARFPARTIFTRFDTPPTPDHAVGRWRKFYEKWPQATRSQLDPQQLELLPELKRFVPPALIVDRLVYSAFFRSRLLEVLKGREATTVIVSGAETDICVLSTVISAVDLGFRVVIVEDAICSSSDQGHEAMVTLYRNRFSQQVEICDTGDVLARWK